LPKEIAANYGITVLFADFGQEHKEVSGFYDGKSRAIYVNVDDNPRRQTFTIAHELCHFLLHGNLFRDHPEDYRVLLRYLIGAAKEPLEQEANCFAANLLVPRSFLDKYYRIASVQELARLFIVFGDVIRFRLQHEYAVDA